MSQQLFRDAIGDSQEQYDVLLTHLSLIRDLVNLGQKATSFGDLCCEVCRAVVTELGYERVVVIVRDDDGNLDVAGGYSQTERFGGTATAVPPVLLTLARDVVTERTLLRWGGQGIGKRRPLPPQLEGSLIGFPLMIGGDRIGAVMCVQVLTVTWDLVSQRALELVGEIVSQLLAVADSRLSMTGLQRGLEHELGVSRTQLTQQEETLRAQSERISGLATSLIASNQAKKTFLALMSHELRTPLSVIMGFSGLLAEGAVGDVNAQQGAYLDRIQINGRHLHQLIEDMLFFVDAETAPISPCWADVSLGALIEDVVHAIPKDAEGGGPSFAMTIPPDADTCRSDETLLRRVLFHLLGNAFKFTQKGEVRVEVERDATDIVIRIIDTGSGISPEQSRRVFELFRQGDDSHTRKHEGVGLGLNLVRACLGFLHGRCHIGPGTPGGTRVELRLPPDTPAAKPSNGPQDVVVDGAPLSRAATRG